MIDVEPVKVGILQEKTRGASWKHGGNHASSVLPRTEYISVFSRCPRWKPMFFSSAWEVSKLSMPTKTLNAQLALKRFEKPQIVPFSIFLFKKKKKQKLDFIESSQQNICTRNSALFVTEIALDISFEIHLSQ